MDSYVMVILLSLICGSSLAFWAKKQGRDPYRWFLAGAFLSVIAVAIVYYIHKGRNEHDLAN